MVIVPVRKQFKELNWKNISVKPENILSIQNYTESMNCDSGSRGVPVGIYDTIKNKLGISRMELFLDGNSKVYLFEKNQNKSNLIEFSNMDNVRRIYRLYYKIRNILQII